MKNWLLFISILLNLLMVIGLFYALHRYGGWKNLWSKIKSRGIEKTYFHRKNLFEEMDARDSSIVFLGNSITAQCEWAELFDDARVLNRGIPGDHCDGVRSRLGEIERLKPVKLFLMIGINDLAYLPPDAVFTKYRILVDSLIEQLPATSIYLQSVLPVNNIVSPTPVDNEDVRVLNEQIRQLARDKQLRYIDLSTRMSDKDGNLDGAYTLDGLHLNGRGYVKWKEILVSENLMEGNG